MKLGRLGKAAKNLGGKVKGKFTRLRDRTGKFAYNGGKKSKIRKNAIVKYQAPKYSRKGTKEKAPKQPSNRKFTVSKLGKAARFAWQNPEKASYFLKNHYLAKAAYSRATLPFRNVRDTIALNIPKPIRSRARLGKQKLNRPINRFKSKYSADFARVWTMPETKSLASFAGLAVTVTAYNIYNSKRNKSK